MAVGVEGPQGSPTTPPPPALHPQQQRSEVPSRAQRDDTHQSSDRTSGCNVSGMGTAPQSRHSTATATWEGQGEYAVSGLAARQPGPKQPANTWLAAQCATTGRNMHSPSRVSRSAASCWANVCCGLLFGMGSSWEAVMCTESTWTSCQVAWTTACGMPSAALRKASGSMPYCRSALSENRKLRMAGRRQLQQHGWRRLQ